MLLEPSLVLILILPVYLTISIPIRLLVKKTKCPLPQNFFLVILSIPIGLICIAIPIMNYNGIAYMPIHHVLAVYFPTAIFATIYRMDFYIFMRALPQVILISLICTGTQVAFLGLILVSIPHEEWSTTMGCIAALILIPIEPANIIDMFKELALYKHLGTVIEAESLLSFIPVYTIILMCIGILDGVFIYWYHYVIMIIRYIVFAVLYGIIMGKMAAIMMSWLYNDANSALTVSIGMTYLTFFLAEYLIYCNGNIATICMVSFVALYKHKYSSEVENCLFAFWGHLNYMFEIMLLMASAVEMTRYVYNFFSVTDLYNPIITYFAAKISRLISFLLVGPIIHKMTYNLNIRCLMVLGWCGVKGSINFLLCIMILHNPSTNKHVQRFFIEVMTYAILTMLINSTSMRLTLKLIGLSELSSIRRTNMNNCMKYISAKRQCILNTLKTNRYLSDANWALVRSETVMKHPYSKIHNVSDLEEDDDWVEDELYTSSNAYCPDCLKEVPFELSNREFNDLMKEARVKVLRAKKVSVIKQYENGQISKGVLQDLGHQFDVAMETATTVTVSVNMKTRNAFLEGVLHCLRTIIRPKITEPPQNNFKRFCYYFIFHIAHYYCEIILVTIYATIFIWMPRYYSSRLRILYVIWLVFFFDLILGILAHSPTKKMNIKNYLKYFWNTWNFFYLLLEFCLMICLYYQVLPEYVEYVEIGRFLKILSLFQLCIPKIIKEIQFREDWKICVKYDLAIAMVNCCDAVLDVISKLVEVKVVRDIIQRQIEQERTSLLKEMEQIQREKPWIAITVKTKQAIRTTLNTMENTLLELKISGFVDNIEYEYIFKEIFERKKFLRNMNFVQPSAPKVIFNEVPWMADDAKIIEFLYNHVEAVSWDAGEVICKDGKFSKGVYIVVTGMLRLKYYPKLKFSPALNKKGNIPIIDYLSTANFTDIIQDNIMSGNSIGELSVLTERPYDCTIVADSPSQAYLLTSDIIKQAIKLNGDPIIGLEARMWKFATINLAVAILMDIPLYQSFTQEQIKFKLERAFMPNLRCYKMFVVTENMEDIILMEGVASDYNTGEIFVAPTVIPRNIQKLILPKSSYLTVEDATETKLLIIPMGDTNTYEIMENEEEIAELVSTPSSKCLLHVVTQSSVPKKKMKRKVAQDVLLSKPSDFSLVSSGPKVIEVLDSYIDLTSTLGRSTFEESDDEKKHYIMQNKLIRSMSSITDL